MATSQDTLNYFLDCLSEISNLYAKAMFGEYGIYSGDRMFALACDNTLFFKTFPETIEFFEDRSTKAYPWSKNTAPVNPEWLESDREMLIRIAMKTIALTRSRKSKKK